ncbi:MAG TPA: type II secretion system secretin GspD [Azoarcus taiwanensis]|nr:type II secretion system secretin GspD [Azoarcus taiwanensis]
MTKNSATKNLKTGVAVLLASAVTGCASLTGAGAPVAPLPVPSESRAFSVDDEPLSTELAAQLEELATPEASPVIVKGTDRMFNPPRVGAWVDPSGAAVTLRFEQAPVTDVVHAVLGDILGVPYVINQPVSGSMTIHTTAPLARDQVLPVFEAMLQANGLAMAVDQAGVYHVGRPETLRGVSPSLGNLGGILPAGQNLLIVPLQYVGAAEMADILRPLTPPESFVRVDAFRNLLILAGSRSRLDGLMELVRTFDVDVLKGMSVALFPLQHASVKEVEAALGAMMGAAGGRSASAPTGEAEGRSDRVATLDVPGPLAGVVRVVAIERLNALLVITPRSHYLEQAREWIERFDQPRTDDEPQLFVYPVQNGTAAHLSKLLTALFGGDASGAAARRADAGVAPGLAPASVGAAPAGASRTSTGTEGAPDPTQVKLGTDVRVVADEFNNALLVHAPRSEYKKIETALRRLDLAPMQVLIEASILEVTLTDELQYGLQWFFHGGIGSDKRGTGIWNPNQSGGIGPSQPGFSYTITDSVGQVRLVLNALAQRSLLNVISSPSLMVLDNHSATIQVGDQQPVRTATTVTEGGVTTSSIQFKDTGVQLNVTPSVNAGGLVTMAISQAVTDVGEIDAATGQRTFLQREINSRVAVRSGETVVLGGLIRDNTTRGKQGVPILQDIPVLGNLFSTTSKAGTRTELIVLITPRALQNDDDLRAASTEIRRRMSATLSALPGWTVEGPVRTRPPVDTEAVRRAADVKESPTTTNGATLDD